MTEPSSHYTQVNDLRLHYLEAGEGEPILLLHGFPTSSHLYRNILPQLAKTHRAIALDLPGYGLSDKPLDVRYDYDFYADVLDSFLDALGIGETNLVVHDLGGPVGLYWAIQNPGRVPKLVILNTLVYPETSWAVKLFLLAMKTPGLRDFIVSPKGIVGTMKLGVVHKDRLNREVLTLCNAQSATTPSQRSPLSRDPTGNPLADRQTRPPRAIAAPPHRRPPETAPPFARSLQTRALSPRRPTCRSMQTALASPREPARGTRLTRASDERRPESLCRSTR